jgi:uncharacterized coiled-coil DUF342 family protein
MSLADQIADLEAEADDARRAADEYERACNELKDENEDLTDALAEAEAFIEYIDKTNPELRTAYEAAKTLEGAPP